MGRGLRTAWLAICACLVVGALGLVFATRVLGLAPIAVRSGSMTPTLPINTLLLVEAVPSDQVRVGDVITFDPPGAQPRTTHRVVERTQRNGRWYFRTKGDANDTPDDWRRGQANPAAFERGITYGHRPALRTKYHVPQVGRLADLMPHTSVRVVLLVLPLVLLFANTVLHIWRPRSRRRSVAEPRVAAAYAYDLTYEDLAELLRDEEEQAAA